MAHFCSEKVGFSGASALGPPGSGCTDLWMFILLKKLRSGWKRATQSPAVRARALRAERRTRTAAARRTEVSVRKLGFAGVLWRQAYVLFCCVFVCFKFLCLECVGAACGLSSVVVASLAKGRRASRGCVWRRGCSHIHSSDHEQVASCTACLSPPSSAECVSSSPPSPHKSHSTPW